MEGDKRRIRKKERKERKKEKEREREESRSESGGVCSVGVRAATRLPDSS